MSPSPFLIHVQGVTHAYVEGSLRREVLQGVKLDFLPGEIAIVVGPSGSGKTTLLTLIGALRSVQTGSVTVLGKELFGATAEDLVEVRRDIGFIFQSHNLIPSLTALENVQLTLAVEASETPVTSETKAREALRAVGLGDLTHRLPAQLSGGQRQRVAIARALVRQPRIILADEPTASLDKQTGREIVKLLEQLARQTGCTLIIVTHDNRILDIADRILTLEDGSVEETHLGLKRLLDQIVQLLEATLGFFGLVQQPDAILRQDEWIMQVTALSEKVGDHLGALQYLRTRPELAVRLEACGTVITHLRSLAETLRQLGTLIGMRPSGELNRLTDQFLQAGEAIMLTAEDALKTGGVDELELLLQITEDRRDVMQRIRTQYFNAQGTLDEAGRNYLFDLTNVFARMIFFLHQIARDWLIASGLKGDYRAGETKTQLWIK